jgi:glycosyltransferase involved in cell wall biosynthesis
MPQLNRLTIWCEIGFVAASKSSNADHIFVHTQEMKSELVKDFGVAERRVTVLRYPLNNALPDTDLTPAEAKRRLDIRKDDKILIFFGKIRPYKGIEHLLTASGSLPPAIRATG